MSQTQRSPGRPRGFEIDEAVRDATEVFHRHGYAGASLTHLLEGTGLTRGSLYKAFEDKHALFLAALDRYAEESLERLRLRLDQPDARAALCATLDYYATACTATLGRKGCLITTATTELLPQDEIVQRRIAHVFDGMRRMLAETIRRGQQQGSIASQQDPQTLAGFLLCTIQGMRVLGKTGPQAEQMQPIIDTAMRLLD